MIVVEPFAVPRATSREKACRECLLERTPSIENTFYREYLLLRRPFALPRATSREKAGKLLAL